VTAARRLRRLPGRGPLLAAVLALVLLVLATLLLPGGNDDADPSSRSAGRDGTLALYSWLGEGGLGLEVRRLTGDFRLTGTDVLVVVEPTQGFTRPELATLDGFLRGGGELIAAVDGRDLPVAAGLLDRLGLAPAGTVTAGDATPVQPLDPGGRVRRVPVEEGLALATPAGVVPLLDRGRPAVLAGRAVGAGRAYLLGSPYPLSNAGLEPRRGDASRLVLALLERSRGGRIAVDEIHHGEGVAAGAAGILLGPVGLAGLLAALVALAFLGLGGRRLGRPLPAGDPARVPSAGEFVTAMARLYERSARLGGVAERYAAELKERVGAVAGVEPSLDDQGFVDRLGGFGQERAEAVALALARARRLAAGGAGDAALLALAREVDEVERAWSPAAAAAEARGPQCRP
jgi:Domain of unknown function (DUF4350)